MSPGTLMPAGTSDAAGARGLQGAVAPEAAGCMNLPADIAKPVVALQMLL